MNIRTEFTTYSVDGHDFKGYLAWDDSFSQASPGILVFPEWWGLNSYIKKRTEQIAELGYLVLGVDMYGECKIVETPEEASSLMYAVLEDKQAIKSRLEVPFNVLNEHALSDAERLGAIGYCFGGALVLNMARIGMGLRAVVSFHGALYSLFNPLPDDVKAKVLVCHGEADEFISKESVEQFKSEMDVAKVDYEFINYHGALHGFSNPTADERGNKFNIPIAYNEIADKNSWNSMKDLFEKNF